MKSANEPQTIEIPALARVEGEGGLYIGVKGGKVNEIRVNIYEPPRFFEGFLRGRSMHEVADITSRICGICPVAYQMSAIQALEAAEGITVTPSIRDLRRLFYCAEYIESHALHIYLLQAPDFFDQESALSLAAVAPDVVLRALRMKKAGNSLLRAIGGRSVHPLCTAVGGFYRWPDTGELTALIPELEWTLEAAKETLRWAAGLPYPSLKIEYEFVALSSPTEYAILDGEVRSSSGKTLPATQFEKEYLESHTAHSNALHSHTAGGKTYMVGPMARLNLNASQLNPIAQSMISELNIRLPLTNPFQNLLARAVEVVHVCEEALALIRGYHPEGPSKVEWKHRAGEGCGVSEAPRGLLFHRYAVDDEGMVLQARIVPPTAQNLARMEADLWAFAPEALRRPRNEATLLCEHLVRSYDPCISCATHFVRLDFEA
jgi:sulfhydrogenase subunit alpha